MPYIFINLHATYNKLLMPYNIFVNLHATYTKTKKAGIKNATVPKYLNIFFGTSDQELTSFDMTSNITNSSVEYNRKGPQLIDGCRLAKRINN